MDNIERVENFIIEHSLKNVSRRNSCKVFSSGEIDLNRLTYCFGTLDENIIFELVKLLCDSKDALSYLSRRCNTKHSFILSFATDSVRFYLDNSFRLHEVVIYSVEITKGIISYREYMNETSPKFILHPMFYPIRQYLKTNSYLVRDDGQVYFRFRSPGKPSPDKIANLSPNIFFKDWVFKQSGDLVWLQFSEKSFTVYYKNA